jgi:alkanesulfonate monooxygenase SsuD/methylene tetrahydromethanopterin reductase-like flavin-dependent oxidoreductase (luciferase family)
VKIGLYFDLRDPVPWRIGWNRVAGRTLEVCEQADRDGIDSLWLSEHHLFEDGYLPQPLTFAAAVAARTRRARIGTAILIAPLRTATGLAEEAAVVDNISDGRLELGLGTGYRVPEFDAFGVDPADRWRLLEARSLEIQELWAAGHVTPRPVQDTIPLWVGAHGPKGARLAGRVGAGLLSPNPKLWAPYSEAAEAGGHEPVAAGPASMMLADDPERTAAIVKPYADHQWAVYDQKAAEGVEPGSALTVFFRKRGQGAPTPLRVLTVERAVAELAALAEVMPLQHVFFWERVGGTPDAVAQRHVELVCGPLRAAVRGLGEQCISSTR